MHRNQIKSNKTLTEEEEEGRTRKALIARKRFPVTKFSQ